VLPFHDVSPHGFATTQPFAIDSSQQIPRIKSVITGQLNRSFRRFEYLSAEKRQHGIKGLESADLCPTTEWRYSLRLPGGERNALRPSTTPSIRSSTLGLYARTSSDLRSCLCRRFSTLVMPPVLQVSWPASSITSTSRHIGTDLLGAGRKGIRFLIDWSYQTTYTSGYEIN
jgi:hypothetical protein